ncbi:ribonuclease T2 [Auricularia subglabra TFB-10046 SS5]|uniref:Ribonuclease T2-like n=1 Tax=Auricularia subglabra (strain TFB-10046 / SS5) TaxID=717982 RepID=J0WU19_AURST|nr:ribonuclease T2 [Auricularia subglabra TFB-10046 SS5]
MPRIASSCSTTGSASCSNSSAAGTCCLEAPGGLLLQTQFWDANPSTGPTDSWTVHGLWPDNCDGTFESNCDSSRAYTNLASLLSAQGASSTVSFMQTFWKDINGDDESFWEHEWSKHGTCLSTLKTSCLPSGSPRGAEAVAYFQTVVKLFQTVPTYDFLSSQGITPSSSKTFTLSQITSALKSASGFTPTVNCDGPNLNEVWWYFHVKGSVIDGSFVPINAPSFASNDCPSSGIKYLPKSGGGSGGGGGGGTTPPASGVPASFTVQALRSSGSTTGGLLSGGTWSTQTLATYKTAASGSGFTLTTSKGPCAVSSSTLTCASGNSASVFTAVSSGGKTLLAFNGSTTFSSDAVPSGTTQQKVFVGSGHSQTYQLVVAS